MTIVRRVEAGKWGAVGVAGSLIIGWSLVFGVAVGSAAAANANPLAAYQGFNVVSFGDVTISAESEGALAVGGNLTFHGTNAGFKGNSDPALLIGGQVDLAASTGAPGQQHRLVEDRRPDRSGRVEHRRQRRQRQHRNRPHRGRL